MLVAEVTAEQVRAFVNGDRSDLVAIEACLTYADEALAKHLADDNFDTAEPIPDVVLERALIVLAAEVFSQQQAPHGIVNEQYASEGEAASTPIRITRNPMPVVYPILALWSDGPAIG